LLEKRFNKTSIKKDSFFTKIFNRLQIILKPFSKKNIKSGQYISNSKKLLLQAGYASSEEDVLKYDSRKLATTFITCVIMFIWLLLDFSAANLVICILVLYFIYKWPEMKLKREIKYRQKNL